MRLDIRSVAFCLLSFWVVARADAAPPQVWTTNVVTGEFPSESAALAAVRSQGGVYTLAEEVVSVALDAQLTRYSYGPRPRAPEVGTWLYRGYGITAPGLTSEDAANAATLAAYNANYPDCHFTSLTPTEDWQTFTKFLEIPSTQARIFNMVASSTTCSTNWRVQQWRDRPVTCPEYLASNGVQCVRGPVATLSSRPLSCDSCDLRGNPISVTTGNKTQKEYDFSLPWIDFYRTYNSAFRAPGGMGGYWTHSLNIAIVQGTSAPNGVLEPDGSVRVFQAGEAIDGSGARRGAINGEQILETGGLRYRFNFNSRLYLIELPAGDTITIAYDTKLRIKRATHSTGRYLDFAYAGPLSDDRSRLTTISDADGVLVTYRYDDLGRLTSATFRDGTSKHYHYENSVLPHALTGITDENAVRLATYGYDADGLATLSEHAGGVARTLVNYASDGTATHTDASGKTETVQFSAADPYRKISSIVTAEGTETKTFFPQSTDFRRRLSSRTDRSGTIEQFNYQDLSDPVLGNVRLTTRIEAVGTPAQRTTKTWRSTSTNRVLKTASPLDSVTYTRNSRGQPLSVVKTDLATGSSRAITFAYCEQADVTNGFCPTVGLRLSENGPAPGDVDTSTYSYYPNDAPGCATSAALCSYRKGDLWKTSNALGHSTEMLAYDNAGRPVSTRDANGVVTEYEYHPRGWMTAHKMRGVDANGESDDQITRFDYFPNGLVSSTTLPDGSFIAYVYDAAQRLTDIVDAEGNSIHYTLDTAGNRTKEEVKGEDGTLRRTLSRAYNQLGQLQTTRDASNHPTGFTYDVNGNLDRTTDPLNRVADDDYDPLKRLSRTIQDVGGIAATTQFRYDAQDNLTEVIDTKGLSTKYLYNAFRDLVQLESPDTGVTTYGYDSAGNRTSAVDARGELSTYTYDALNRLTGVVYTDATLNVSYVYDALQPECEPFESFAVGRLTRMTDGSGETRYCHDRFGNLTRKVQVTNGQTFTLRYAYTKAGHLSAIQYPDGMQVDYVRDGLGRATEVGVTPSGGVRQVLLTGATYHSFGPVAGWTFGNGRTISRTLDLDYRPSTILSTGVGAGGLNLGFGWDAVGNLVSLHTSGLEQPPRITFGYDALNRLTAFKDGPTGATIEGYTYDATGNRTSFTNAGGTQIYDYPASSHRLDAVNGLPRTYDAIGNTTSIGGVERMFAYSAAGRMSRVERNNTLVMEYSYNGLGEQVCRQLAETRTYALYDESGHWLGDYGSPQAPQQQVLWLDDLPVAVTTSGGFEYIEADHLGTPRAVIDHARDLAIWTWDMASEAFGNSSPNQDPDADGVPRVINMRYPGQRYDAATGLNYNYFRDYDVEGGRYIESDPIGLAGGISTYAYVSSRPLNDYDPTGLEGANDFPRRIDPVTARRMRQRECANRAFWQAYGDMRAANYKRSDKYFHCRANCEATKCGPAGYEEACEMSDNREAFDQTFKGDSAAASAADQAANRHGREGARSRPNQSCQITCAPYRPKGLPSQY